MSVLAPFPQPHDLEGEHADGIKAQRREMAKEQRNDAGGRQQEPYRPGPLAHHDPAGQGPQRHADSKDVVHQSDEEDVIIEQRNGEEGQGGPASVQHAAQHQRAGNNEREHRDDEHLAGEIDVHDTRQRRHQQIHGQVRDPLPIQLIESCELHIGGQRRDRMHARQVIDVVRQRRQRMRPDRYRDQQREGGEKNGDLRSGESRRAKLRRRNDRRRARRP